MVVESIIILERIPVTRTVEELAWGGKACRMANVQTENLQVPEILELDEKNEIYPHSLYIC